MERIHFLDDGSVELWNGGERPLARTRLEQVIPSAQPGLLPRGCRHVFGGEGRKTYVIEQPPAVRDVRWPPDGEPVPLAFPYVLFLVRANADEPETLRVFFRAHPLRSRTDYLFDLGFPEIDARSLLAGRDRGFGETLEDRVSAAVSAFWTLPFPRFSDQVLARVPTVASLTAWRDLSRTDPLWVLSAKWPACDQPLDQVVAGSAGGGIDTTFSFFAAPLSRDAPVPAGRADRTVRESPVRGTMIASVLVRLGDEVMAKGNAAVVLGFYENAAGEIVSLRLEGIDGTVALRTVTPVASSGSTWRTVSDWTDANGTRWSRGTQFVVTNREDVPALLTDTTYAVKELRVFRDGALEARIENDGRWVFLTREDGVPFPAISLLRPVLTENSFRFGANELKVGTYIRTTGLANVPKTLRVSRVWADPKDAGEILAAFEGIEKPICIFRANALLFRWETIPFERTERRVSYRGTTIDLEHAERVICDQVAGYRPGVRANVVGFVRSAATGADPFDTDLVLSPGNEPVPVIRDGQWIPFRIRPVWTERSFGALELRRGMRLKATQDCGPLRAGTVLEIDAVTTTTQGVATIEFADGWRLPIGKEGLSRFARVSANDKPRPFSERERETLPILSLSSEDSRELETGALVEYVGKEPGVLEKLRGSAFGTNVVEFIGRHCSQCPVKVRLRPDGDAIDLTRSNGEMRRVSGLPTRSETIRKLAPRTVPNRFVSPDGTGVDLPPELLKLLDPAMQIRAGVHTTTDTCKPVRVGDVVRADSPTRWSVPSLQEGAVGIVTGFGIVQEKVVLFLLCAREQVRDAANDKDFGYSEIPSSLRPTGGPLRTGLTQVERLTIFETVSEFSPGTWVSVREGVVPTYGWGKVTPTDRGRVLQVLKDEALVAFPEDPEWMSPLAELAPARPRVGDRVRLRADIVPAYMLGTLKKKEEGTVVGEKGEDFLVVDFPSHPGWHAHPDDLTITSLPPSS